MSDAVLDKQVKKQKTRRSKVDPEIGVSLSWKTLKIQKQLIFMSVPIAIYLIIFNYVPVWGWIMAFQNYRPALSFGQQEWVGFQQFKFLFSDETFMLVLRNTVAMSFINLVLGTVTAIGLALLLNEIRAKFFKRIVQSISYLPHFLSWVIAAGIVATSCPLMTGLSMSF